MGDIVLDVLVPSGESVTKGKVVSMKYVDMYHIRIPDVLRMKSVDSLPHTRGDQEELGVNY